MNEEWILTEHSGGKEREYLLLKDLISKDWDIKKIKGEFNTGNDVKYLDVLESLFRDADKAKTIEILKIDIESLVFYKEQLKNDDNNIVFFMMDNGDYIHKNVDIHKIIGVKEKLIDVISHLHVDVVYDDLSTHDKKIYMWDRSVLLNAYVKRLCYKFCDLPKEEVISALEKVKLSFLLGEDEERYYPSDDDGKNLRMFG